MALKGTLRTYFFLMKDSTLVRKYKHECGKDVLVIIPLCSDWYTCLDLGSTYVNEIIINLDSLLG